MPGRRVLVAGASGFLGSEIIRQGVIAGHRVRALVHSRAVADAAQEQVKGDLLEPGSLQIAVQGVDLVIHAAGLAHVFKPSADSARNFHQINETGSLNLAHAAANAGVADFVLVSSVSVYGRCQKARDETAVCRPESPYGRSKWRSEHVTAEVAAKTGMKLTIVRLATVYGEADPGNVWRLVRAIDRGRFVWLGNGNNRKSLIYRMDAARACLLAAERAHSGVEIFNVTAPAVTVSDVVRTIADALGARVSSLRVPASVGHAIAGLSRALSFVQPAAALGDALEKWLGNDEYDGRRFESALNFRPEVSLEEGIKREVGWYRRAIAVQ